MTDLYVALEFARAAHKEQTYGQHELPYYYHLCEVVSMTGKYGTINDQIVAALHDILEDTDVTQYVLEQIFGADTTFSVVLVTDPSGENRKTRKQKLYEQFRGYPEGPQKKSAALVKLVDRFVNHRHGIDTLSLSKSKMYANEFDEFIAVFGIYPEHAELIEKLNKQILKMRKLLAALEK